MSNCQLRDIHLIYDGASGGHFLAHLILLSGKHVCVFDGDHETKLTDTATFHQQLQKVIERQWCIDIDTAWKSLEIWPNNPRTFEMQAANAQKFFLSCLSKPTDLSRLDLWPGTRILLYVNIDLQIKLARFKQANWFNGTKYDILSIRWQKLYSRFRKPYWPNITYRHLDLLADEDLDYLCECHDDFYNLIYPQDMLAIPCIEWQGQMVSYQVADIAASCDVWINLQQLVKDIDSVFLPQLQLTTNRQHFQLIDTWLYNHPNALRTKIIDL